MNNEVKSMENDRLFLLRSVEIAREGIRNGGGPFGAVLTRNDEIISEAYNRVIINTDPTAHAEILAIRQASLFLKSHDLSGCTLYSSCEPCPMCLGAVYWAGIRKVIFSADRSEAARAGFSDKLIYEEIMLDPGKRKISFIRLNDTGGREVFREWDQSENKRPY